MPAAAEAIARSARPREKRERRSYPIAMHMALFAIGTLMPVLLIVTVMLVDTARLRRDDALHDATVFVGHLNATIELEIEKAIAVAQTLATSPALANRDYAAFDTETREVANRLGLVIVTRDRSGQQVTSTALRPGDPLPVSNESILAADRLAAEKKAPMVSDLVFGTVLKTTFVIADIPVIKGSEVTYFIDVVLRPQRLTAILAQGLPEGWIAGVIGRDGRLIARSTQQDRYAGTVNKAFMDLATRSDGVWTGTTREGDSVAGAYVRSPLSGWIVSVAVPESVLQAPAQSALAWLGALCAAALAVSLWFGWRLSRRISSPMRDLVARARELGEGRRPASSRSRVAEVNDVTDALLTASVELDRRAVAAQRAADTVRANEERLQLAQDTAGIGTVDWDIATGRAVCSPRFYEMFSLLPDSPVRFADFIGRVHEAERERLQRAPELLVGPDGRFQEEFRVVAPDGEEHWIHARGRLDLIGGLPVRLLGASIDITERKRSEEHLRFLLREISHRSKNLLAVIQAMAGQTAKSAESVEDFRRRFGERLMGMAASHDLLVNQNWLGVSVGQLVRGQLAAFVDANDRRVKVRGPEVDLTAEAAEALGLALHELASNSMRFGALGDHSGTVEINWAVQGPGAVAPEGEAARLPDGRRFWMEWIEHTVRPVTPPSHKGFGRMVIEHTVAATLRGKVTLDFPPEGMRWNIDAPVTCLALTRRGMAA